MIGYASHVFLRDPIVHENNQYNRVVTIDEPGNNDIPVDKIKVDRNEVVCIKEGTPSLVIPLDNVAGLYRKQIHEGDSPDNVIDP